MSAERLCSVADLEPGTARRFDVDGHRIALVRLGDGDFRAVGDRCTHQDYSLAEGEVDVDGCTIECWKHGALFSLDTGEPLTLPAVRPTPTYPVRVEGDDVWVELP